MASPQATRQIKQLNELIARAQTLVNSMQAITTFQSPNRQGGDLRRIARAVVMQLGLDGNQNRLIKTLSPRLFEQVVVRILDPSVPTVDVYRWLGDKAPQVRCSIKTLYRLSRAVRRAYLHLTPPLSLPHRTKKGRSNGHRYPQK